MDGGVLSTSNISPDVKAEAAAWLARLRADDRTADDERAFQAWLKADPSHAAAFEAVTLVWEATGAVSRADRDLIERERAPERKPVLSRRAVMAGVTTLVVAGGSLVALRQAYAGVYETDVGEQKHVTLDDGTQVFLDTDTRIKVSFSEGARFVDLQRGRANFRVAPDARRAFVVEAAAKRIVTGRTIFDVRRDGERVSVVLIQGKASVDGAEIQAGQRLIAAQSQAAVDKPNLTQVLAWQTGQAIFDNQTLAEAVAEMNRYSTVKLKIADRNIAALRMSGVYRVGDNAAFAHSVAKLLPIEVRAGAGSVDLVADLTRLPQR
jgi:transmembrane sensor